MASPQWKSFQPPVQDPAILAFQHSQQQNFGSTVMQQTGSNNMSNGIRETGFVEKLLHSYGFIQCCDREARLFFHFSEYSGDIENMKSGDSVEFQMSYDRRTGKPIAVSVIKLPPGTVGFEILSEERVTGTVAAEAKPVKNRNSVGGSSSITDGLGRVSYERSGECFFLPFGVDDVDGPVKLKAGDQVTFFIATDKRTSNIQARQIKLLAAAAQQERCQGVVCSMKDTFGFIERSDMVKEIFFHYSEYQGNINELILGDDVDFSVTTRNGKEVATAINRLPEGTVIFEDISLDRFRGKIQKTLKAAHGRRQSDPLAGRIVYETKDGSKEIPYGDKDQRGEYTLQPGDLVEFNIATDRRDKLQRGTNIEVVQETFKANMEERETGVIASVKDGFGFIKCAERDARMFFHFSEMMDSSKEVKIQEEVEFCVIQDPTATNRQIAIRIKYLPKGSISFETVTKDKYTGVVEQEPATHKSPGKNKEAEHGTISYEVNGKKQTVVYSVKSTDIRQQPKYGDKVEFNISEMKRNNSKTAVNVKVTSRNSSAKSQGFIATLKENFGFIETAAHDKEVFFHFSSCQDDPNELDLGDEVEYSIARKSAKVCAENIRKLNKGTVSPEITLKGIYEGKIIRPMRIINPEQDEYHGIVQVGMEDNAKAKTYPYGITGLADKRDFLQTGDVVKFQLCKVKATGKERATNIAAVRKYVRAKVDSVKGQFGFLAYEVAEGKKLFFHMTEVHDGAELAPGDEVEFVVVQNQRNGKYSACSLRKLTKTQRPEHLISRLKSISDDCPKVTVIRQPKGPDGTKGFSQPRTLWNVPG